MGLDSSSFTKVWYGSRILLSSELLHIIWLTSAQKEKEKTLVSDIIDLHKFAHRRYLRKKVNAMKSN